MSDIGADRNAAADESSEPGEVNLLSGNVRGHAVQAGTIHGDVHFHHDQSAPLPTPIQLPPVPPNFVNRAAELDALTELLGKTEPEPPLTLVVLMGTGGVGKTALALKWLSALRDRCPAGQLHADLSGHAPEQSARPVDVLGWFLRAVGVPPERVPLELSEAAGLWRSVTNGRRLMMLLDNAASAAQIRTILPGAGPSLVVVTSRWRLAGLAIDGAHFLDLPPLQESDGVELLGKIAGTSRTTVEPEAARSVVDQCGGLPLAVCISAARLALNPRWQVSRVAAELATERQRLAALSLTEDTSVQAAFDFSYEALPAEAAHIYRLLSLIPGPYISAGLAAAATATPISEITRLLDALTNASLLAEAAENRYRFHDLIRLHAREKADNVPDTQFHEVISRSIDWYLDSAVAADLVVIPGRWQLGHRYLQAREASPAFTSPNEALTWLEDWLPGLLAAVNAARYEGLHERAWQLCEALWGLFVYRRHFQHWIASHEVGMASAQACGNLRAEAKMRDQLGFAYLSLRRYPEARSQFTAAASLAAQAGHRLGEAAPLEHLGLTLLAMGRPDEALPYFIRGRDVYKELGRPRGAALAARHIGEAHRDAGRHQDATDALLEARRLFAGLPDPYNEARTLTGLAETHIRAGQPAEAEDPLREALAIMTSRGARDKEAGIHVLLAETASLRGDHSQARDHLNQALTIYTDLDAPETAQVRQRLSEFASAEIPEDT